MDLREVSKYLNYRVIYVILFKILLYIKTTASRDLSKRHHLMFYQLPIGTI